MAPKTISVSATAPADEYTLNFDGDFGEDDDSKISIESNAQNLNDEVDMTFKMKSGVNEVTTLAEMSASIVNTKADSMTYELDMKVDFEGNLTSLLAASGSLGKKNQIISGPVALVLDPSSAIMGAPF